MPITYALVARGDVVLAHYTSTSGNFITVTSFLLKKIPSTDDQVSFQHNEHTFHYIVEKGITFLCLTEDSFDRRIAFAFLFETKDRCFSRYPQEALDRASAFSLNEEFSRVLANQMLYLMALLFFLRLNNLS